MNKNHASHSLLYRRRAGACNRAPPCVRSSSNGQGVGQGRKRPDLGRQGGKADGTSGAESSNEGELARGHQYAEAMGGGAERQKGKSFSLISSAEVDWLQYLKLQMQHNMEGSSMFIAYRNAKFAEWGDDSSWHNARASERACTTSVKHGNTCLH